MTKAVKAIDAWVADQAARASGKKQKVKAPRKPIQTPSPGSASTVQVVNDLVDAINDKFKDYYEVLNQLAQDTKKAVEGLEERIEGLERNNRALVKAPAEKLVTIESEHRLIVQYEGERYYVLHTGEDGVTTLEPVNTIEDLAG